jgi:hypothetical protein
MIRTGKSGRYCYYAGSGYRLKGLTACGKPMANVSPTVSSAQTLVLSGDHASFVDIVGGSEGSSLEGRRL